jgi:desulfoferrodoxin (superoxide reductase-like protein)
MKITRIVAALLSFMMLVCACVSCGKKDTANYEKIFVCRIDPDDPLDRANKNFVSVTNEEELLAAINYCRNTHPTEKYVVKSFCISIYFNDDINVQLEMKTDEFCDYTKNRYCYLHETKKADGTVEYYVSLSIPENEDDEYYVEWLKSLSENEKIKTVKIMYQYWDIVLPVTIT